MINRRKVRMTSSQHAPYVLGYTRATKVKIKFIFCEKILTIKFDLSSDSFLEFEMIKLESLVIAS